VIAIVAGVGRDRSTAPTASQKGKEMSSIHATGRALRLLVCLVVALPCAAAGPPAQERPRSEPVQPAPRRAAAQNASLNLPSSVLGGGGTQSKIKVTSTDAKGDCPAGATKFERCSGVYPNGNSWEISPCCHTVID
jgi:hypothetical protein